MRTLQRLRGSWQGASPLIPLLLTVGAAAVIYFGDQQRGSVLGFAQAVPEAISATEPGRIATLHVSVGDAVVAGQILVTLDTGAIDAEIALAHAEKARIEAEVRAEQALLEQRLDIDLEGLERTLLAQREEQLRANAEVKALDGEIARVRRLVEDRQAVLGDLAQLNLRHATMAAVVQQKPRTMNVLARHVQAAEERRQKTKQQSFALAAKLTADLEVAARKIERLTQRRATFVLRATRSGRVAALDRRAGEVVGVGEPVVRLVSASSRVVACVPERVSLSVHEGDSARLWVRGQRSDAIEGKTIAVGPVVTELPTRCWTSPRVPAWGREITIALDPAVDVVPGQAFDISVQFARGVPTAVPLAPTAPIVAPLISATQPRLVTVPESLSRRTRFEPSGIVRRAGESRYLIVSDDTGYDADEGQPWLFAMSSAGVIEPDPIPLAGVSKINDLEAITEGASGEIYLLSSQSYSKKGKRKPSRTALLRVKPEGAGFRVDGEVHLAEMLDADTDRAASLGLPDGTRALDIEGMTFHDGALYLGLKAPLDARGDAMIWKVASPAALFASPRSPTSRLSDAGVSLWAHARVDVEIAGRATPGGISELLFMPDGTLVMTSTPSTAEGAAGAIWRVDRPRAGALAPRLVQRFVDLKPEGITPSLTPGKVMVVFDAGSATPSFLDLPWGP